MTTEPTRSHTGTPSTQLDQTTEDSLDTLDPPDPSELQINDDDEMDMPNLPGTDSSGPGIEELKKFRDAWRQDLQARGRQGGSIHRDAVKSEVQNVNTSSKPPSGSGGQQKLPAEMIQNYQNIPRDSGSLQAPIKTALKSPVIPPDLDEEYFAPGPSTLKSKITERSKVDQLAESKIDRKDQAVRDYSRAVESEQAGKLNEALMLYRKAFKLDDNVDRLYARSIAKATQKAASETTSTMSSADIVSSAPPAEEPYSFQRHIQTAPDYEKSQPLQIATSSSSPTAPSTTLPVAYRASPLTTLLQKLPISPEETVFLPENENLPIPLAKLPIELLDPIFRYMDVATIERFGSTCWRARYTTSRSLVWRRIVEGILKSSAIFTAGLPECRSLVERRYGGEWRNALIEEERVRMDGCYISVCHYIRPGAGDQWVTITHMITYHRFLRFYPDGSVISFLTTDHPSEVVPLLRPSLRGKGLHFGRWRLIRSDSPENSVASQDTDSKAHTISNSHKRRARIVITDLLEPETVSPPKYEFEMSLSLRETVRGKWNKLDILNYNSINLQNGESLELSLKHQKPFYFSKVMSYHPQL